MDFKLAQMTSPHPREQDVVKATRSDSVELRQVFDCGRIHPLGIQMLALKVPVLQNKY